MVEFVGRVGLGGCRGLDLLLCIVEVGMVESPDSSKEMEEGMVFLIDGSEKNQCLDLRR